MEWIGKNILRFKVRKKKSNGKYYKWLVSWKISCSMSDRAKKFGVNQPAIFYPLKRINFPWKKKQLRYRERKTEERIKYYQLSLEFLSKKSGSKSLVFIDKSGFEDNQDCIYAW